MLTSSHLRHAEDRTAAAIATDRRRRRKWGGTGALLAAALLLVLPASIGAQTRALVTSTPAATVNESTASNPVPPPSCTVSAPTTASIACTYTVSLSTVPTGTVTVRVESSDTSAATVKPESLMFTADDWWTGKSLTITAKNDDVANPGGARLGTIKHTPSGGGFSQSKTVHVTIKNEENETPGVTFSPATVTVTEGKIGTGDDDPRPEATYTVNLDTKPTGPVTVTLVSEDVTIAKVSPRRLAFTTSNWKDPQTVTVTGVNDGVDNPAPNTRSTNIKHTFSGGGYDSLSESVAVTVNDEVRTDAKIIVAPRTITVKENGSTTYNVVLNNRPSGPVRVALAITAPELPTPKPIEIAPTSLNFGTSNWKVPQTVTVTGVDDEVDNNPDPANPVSDTRPATITYTPTGGGYSTPAPAPTTTVTVTDNEDAQIIVPESLSVTEGNETDYSVRLSSRMLATVSSLTVALSVDTADVTVSPSALTFATATWNTAQTVTVTDVGDEVDNPRPREATITHTATGYGESKKTKVRVTDDGDKAYLTITGFPSELKDDSAGNASRMYTVKSNTLPPDGQSITVAITSSDPTVGFGASLASTTVTTLGACTSPPTPPSCSAEVTIGIPFVDPGVDNPWTIKNVTITHDPSGGGSYDTAPAVKKTLKVIDSDESSELLPPSSVTVTEGATTGKPYVVRLRTAATADVTVSLTSEDYIAFETFDKSSTVNVVSSYGTGSVAIASGSKRSETVWIFGKDDDVDNAGGSRSATIRNTAGGYLTKDVPVTVSDHSDTAGMKILSLEEKPITSITTEEGAAGKTFTVELDSSPTATVTVHVVSADPAAVTVAPVAPDGTVTDAEAAPALSLTFSETTWFNAQTVAVIGAEDQDGDDESTSVTLTPVDGGYDSVRAKSLSIRVKDDETKGLDGIPEDEFEITEGQSPKLGIELATRPTAGKLVTVTIRPDNSRVVTVKPSSLTFSTANWEVSQTVTITGVADAESRDRFATITFSPSGGGYGSAQNERLRVKVDNDDTAKLIVDPAQVTVDEGSTATYEVSLNSKPSETVTVTVSATDAVEVSPESLTFEPESWNVSQTVTVTGKDDQDVADATATITHTGSSGDSNYDKASAKVQVTVTDDDATATLSTSTVTVAEALTATYTLKLDGEPAGDVTVTLESSDEAAATVSPETLTFTTANWNRPQTVTVTGVNNQEDDEGASRSVTITHTFSGGGFDDLTDTVSVTVTDDDGVVVSKLVAVEIPEAGGTASYTVKLNSQPAGTVTVAVASNDATAATVSPSTLTFTAANWSRPQTVTVTGVPDNVDNTDNKRTVYITHIPSGYGESAEQKIVTVTVIDDDAAPAGVTLSVDRPRVGESAGATPITITATVNGTTRYADPKSITVAVGDTDDSAREGEDYQTVGDFPVRIAAGADSGAATFTLRPTDDTDSEGDEGITVSGESAGIAVTPTEITLEDDDAPLILSIAAEPVEEGDTGTKALLFTATLSRSTSREVTVDYAFAGGTATLGTDYEAPPDGTLTFAPEETEKTLTVTVIGDEVDEDDETVQITLSEPSDYTTLISGVALGVIVDDDAPPVLSISGGEVTEGATAPLVFTVTKAGATSKVVTVDYQVGGTAEARADYEAFSEGTLTFLPREDSKVLTVTVIDDDVDEIDETVEVTLSNPVNAMVDPDMSTAMGTIDDDDDESDLSISGGEVTEGTAGATAPLVFTVAKAGATSKVVTVDYAVTGGTAEVGADYEEFAAGTLTFAPGETSKDLTITVMGDDMDEDDETVDITLSNPLNATLAPDMSTAVGTIVDDDDPPVLSIRGETVTEGSGVITPLVFTVTKAGATSKVVTVDYQVGGTAEAGTDYEAFNGGTLTFAPGETEMTLTVAVMDDDVDEYDETVEITLSNPVNATLAPGESMAVGTIEDDDAPSVLSISGGEVTEGDAGTTTPLVFTVTKAGATSKVVTVGYAVTDGTAEAGADYEALAAGTLTFAPEETSKDLTITVIGDDMDEDDESVVIALSSPVNATLAPDMSAAVGTIEDDDEPPVLSIRGETVTEGAAGTTTPLAFTVTKDGATSKVVTVDYQVGGTAEAGADYEAFNGGTLTFAPGETERILTVAVLGDDMDEDDETVEITLSNPVNATLAPDESMAAGTIEDDDAPSVLSIRGETVAEGAAGTTTPLVFTVAKAGATSKVVTVGYAVTGGTARSGEDYKAFRGGRLTFAPAATEQRITIMVNGDDKPEADETVEISLRGPVNATLAEGRSKATGTITDDDVLPTVARDWMARFGRAAAAATVDAIARRMNDGADVDEQSLTLAGRRVSFADATQPLQAPAAARIEPWEDGTVQSISLQDLAEEAAFDIGRSLEDGYLSVWGASSYHQFESAPKDQYTLGGNLVSAILGADHAGDNHVAGLALAYHAGGGEYGDIANRGDFTGALEASLFSFHPYVRLTIGDFHVGASFGAGTGTMNINPDGGKEVETGVTMTALGAIDARYDLSLAPDWQLAVQADAQTVHMVSAEEPPLPVLETATNRVRLGLETSYAILVGEGMILAPTLETGLRHDGGDAETGFGLDASGGLRFTAAAVGLMVDAHGSAAWKNWSEEQNQAPELREWAIGGVIRWRPDFGGHGPEVTLAPTYDGLALEAAPSLDAAVGYRLPAFGGILTPYSSAELAGSGQRSYSAGARFEVDRAVEVSAEGTYRQAPAGDAEQFLTLRVRLQQ